jgi:hypothetical protein
MRNVNDRACGCTLSLARSLACRRSAKTEQEGDARYQNAQLFPSFFTQSRPALWNEMSRVFAATSIHPDDIHFFLHSQTEFF